MRLTEPRVAPVAEAAWTEEQREALSRIRVNGQLLNIFSTLANHMDAYRAFMGWSPYIFSLSGLEPRHREMLMLRIGWLAQAEYEWAQHAVIAKRLGMTDEELRRIAAGPDAEGWTPHEAALLRATDELYADAFITDSTWDALAAEYDTQQMMDVVFTVGQYHLVSMVLNSLGVQIDEGIDERFPRDVPYQATVNTAPGPRLTAPRVPPIAAEGPWNETANGVASAGARMRTRSTTSSSRSRRTSGCTSALRSSASTFSAVRRCRFGTGSC